MAIIRKSDSIKPGSEHCPSQFGSISSTALFAGTTISLIGSQWANAQFQEQLYTVSSFPTDIAIADINGDAASDMLVSVTSKSASVAVFINNGDGTLQDAQVYGARDSLRSIAVADLNGDTYRDIIAGGEGFFSVYLNDGTGAFSEPVDYDIPNNAWADDIVACDIDNDKDTDIVLATAPFTSYLYAKVYVFANDGNGSFDKTRAVISFNSEDVRSVIAGDLDNDGDIDLAATTWTNKYNYYYSANSDIRILINDSGDGSTWSIDKYSVRNTNHGNPPEHVMVGDYDGDGDLDVSFTIGRSVEMCIDMLKNDGSGTFTWTPSVWKSRSAWDAITCSADYTGDGDIDIFVGTDADWPNQKMLSNRDNESGFDEITIPVSTEWSHLLTAGTGDLNGDSLRDYMIGVRFPEFGVLVIPNPDSHPGPVYQVSDLVKGEPATFSVTGARPFERVYMLYNMGISGPVNSVGITQLGGLTLDLADPIVVLKSVVADENGNALLEVTVPANAPRTELTTQAVIRRSGERSVKSNYVVKRIN